MLKNSPGLRRKTLCPISISCCCRVASAELSPHRSPRLLGRLCCCLETRSLLPFKRKTWLVPESMRRSSISRVAVDLLHRQACRGCALTLDSECHTPKSNEPLNSRSCLGCSSCRMSLHAETTAPSICGWQVFKNFVLPEMSLPGGPNHGGGPVGGAGTRGGGSGRSRMPELRRRSSCRTVAWKWTNTTGSIVWACLPCTS
mmetsp:Transcript_33190/g.93998  ORF Transcript_33190/g.93998 Transcript_33190/m.93998 type:complete len:201 (-) Transcript_33190:587-1189(-)